MKTATTLKIRLFPILFLVLGLGVTFYVSYSAFHDLTKISRYEFESICQSFENKIQVRLNSNAQILYSSAAFMSSSDTISRNEWREFQYLNKSFTELTGIQGIGYIIVIAKKQLRQFEQQIRDEGFPEFKVRIGGDRNFYTSVLYIEPFTGDNLHAFGFDGFTEPSWQKAMSQSLDEDHAVVSEMVNLVLDPGKEKQPGNIMFVPVFKSGIPKENPEDRKSALLGWVYSTFRMDDLLKGISGQWDYQTIRLKVYDDKTLIPDKLLFDSDSAFKVKHTSRPALSLKIPLNFDGKEWMLDFSRYKNQSFLLPVKIIITLTEGVIISLLLFILVISLINARTRSVQIQVLNEELKKVNMNKDRFISLLAHDLKSPFNSLLGFSELMAEHFHELEKDEIEDYINRIYSSAKVTYLLLDELLIWAGVQSDQFPFHPEKLNLNDLCRNLIADYTLVADEKNISVSFDDTEVTFVKADELMLKTILRNLLVNAIKFTNENGSVRISLAKIKEKVIVSVSDTGIGLSPEEKAKLFDITQIYSTSGTANEKGTGLGLMLCKDMVIKHKGEIWVESTLGIGSTFRFTLPLAQ